ncbi:hypothetical protein IEQ34_022714 [Dendrobium chrysotoxum]|uniref:Uncharacterized protein n=1 Tax=Dendrobium chrysotoxum TaxID=161865 RepID=A0AAV7FYJ1_DENCH|nr:hypothetical protein IEQ34_022714 [Dendrobium chrysotoxum]
MPGTLTTSNENAEQLQYALNINNNYFYPLPITIPAIIYPPTRNVYIRSPWLAILSSQASNQPRLASFTYKLFS